MTDQTADAPEVRPEARLEARLAGLPATARIIGHVLHAWPDHAAYLLKSLDARTPEIDATVERASIATERLIAGREATVAADYRWTCDQLRDEELFFHREGRYRRNTFAAALADIYSDTEYMQHYVNGLLLTQILWYNHTATLDMLVSGMLAKIDKPFDYLEVGPGHGLMCYFAASLPGIRSLEAWDVSAVSLEETRHALAIMGVEVPVKLTQMDILADGQPDRTYDVIVISEVLEHLERPDIALGFLRQALAPDGRIFINVPLNSPSPDHIYLLESPEEVKALVENAGFAIEDMQLFATQGRPVEKALRNKITVSVGVLAKAA